jgi:rhodanese-related sulfurtransferase
MDKILLVLLHRTMSTTVDYFQTKLEFEIDPSDVKEALDAGAKIVVIDARKENAFAAAHIPGAVNLPHRKMNTNTTAQLAKDFLYVVYCDGIGCNASTKGCLQMAKLGFKVKELIGGLEAWKLDGFATHSSRSENATECAC